MKRVRKGPEPAELAAYKRHHPTGTWEAFRKSRNRYRDCLNRVLSDQHNLCAYCEKEIHAEATDDDHRIEHFHPKSDTSTGHNWALDWNNILAVCAGGETHPDKNSYPLPENLSCDSHKNHLCNDPASAAELTINIEKNLMNPLDLPSFTNLFSFDKDSGHLWPDNKACQVAKVNACKLLRTIHILNLNCKRLAKARLNVFEDIENMMEYVQTLKDINDQERMDRLLKGCFGTGLPQYFTTYRCCLGQEAEKYLQHINYNG